MCLIIMNKKFHSILTINYVYTYATVPDHYLKLQNFLLFPGKTNCKEGSDKSKDDSELWSTVEAQAAFLGPNIWDKTLPYDSDLKVSLYLVAPTQIK